MITTVSLVNTYHYTVTIFCVWWEFLRPTLLTAFKYTMQCIYVCVCVCACIYMCKEMATHSSILAWRIPWTEEPGGLQSKGSQRVGHDWATEPSLSLSYINKHIYTHIHLSVDFPGGSDGKASAYNAGDPGLIPGLGRSPREGNGNSLQYACLENSMDGGAW